MDYYIKGDAARSEEIKATFEKLGVASNADRYNYKNDNVLYFTAGGMIHMIDANGSWANIIKTHPGYKELELPVEPKFNVGDWIVYNDGNTFCLGEKEVQVQAVEKDCYIFTQDGSGFHKFIDDHCRLWTLADAKDGDVLAANECYVIFKEIDGLNIKCYCTYHYMGFNPSFHIDTLQNKTAFNPATKEQRDLLFAKIKEAGYEWDEEKKELRKIQSHYDIANFKPFDKVLVRDRNDEPWRIAFYGYYNEEAHYSHFVGTCWSKQCIPFNEDTKHLLGTNDPCDECYINW